MVCVRMIVRAATLTDIDVGDFSDAFGYAHFHIPLVAEHRVDL